MAEPAQATDDTVEKPAQAAGKAERPPTLTETQALLERLHAEQLQALQQALHAGLHAATQSQRPAVAARQPV